MRNFDDFMNTLTESINDWDYYVDFDKPFTNIKKIENEINIIQKYLNSNNCKDNLINFFLENKESLKIIPYLLAINDNKIIINNYSKNKMIKYNFQSMTNSVNEYQELLEKSGIKNLLENNKIKNINDYLLGVFVGLNSNARKNRTGTMMENIIESILINNGFIKNTDFFTQKNSGWIQEKFKIDLSPITNDGGRRKIFDFILIIKNKIIAIEVNFYNTSGSKLNETSRSYELIFEHSKEINNFKFLWITDGFGWKSTRSGIKDVFNKYKDVYNLNDLKKLNLLELLK